MRILFFICFLFYFSSCYVPKHIRGRYVSAQYYKWRRYLETQKVDTILFIRKSIDARNRNLCEGVNLKYCDRVSDRIFVFWQKNGKVNFIVFDSLYKEKRIRTCYYNCISFYFNNKDSLHNESDFVVDPNVGFQRGPTTTISLYASGKHLFLSGVNHFKNNDNNTLLRKWLHIIESSIVNSSKYNENHPFIRDW